jgi:hypothetical protein
MLLAAERRVLKRATKFGRWQTHSGNVVDDGLGNAK